MWRRENIRSWCSNGTWVKRQDIMMPYGQMKTHQSLPIVDFQSVNTCFWNADCQAQKIRHLRGKQLNKSINLNTMLGKLCFQPSYVPTCPATCNANLFFHIYISIVQEKDFAPVNLKKKKKHSNICQISLFDANNSILCKILW